MRVGHDSAESQVTVTQGQPRISLTQSARTEDAIFTVVAVYLETCDS